jgi:hypothetical protein
MKLRRARDDDVPILDHVMALLAEMDVRYQALLSEKDLRYQQRFDAQGQALTAALAAAERGRETAMIAAEKAVDKANTANEKRFESVNEFRKALTDQTATFPSRVELGALAQRVTDLATRVDKSEGAKTGISDSAKMLLAVGGFIFTAVSLSIGLYLALHK